MSVPNFSDLMLPHPSTTWAVHIRHVESGETLLAHNADLNLKTASVPKLLILIAAAQRYTERDFSFKRMLRKDARYHGIAGTGIWQHLSQQELPAQDILRLIGSVSDNIATNVMIDHLGLDTIQNITKQLGIEDVHLHDRVRSLRDETHPPSISSASAAGLSKLMLRIATNDFPHPLVGSLVGDWLNTYMDTSMLAGQFHPHPLLTNPAGNLVRIQSKTGTDQLVAAEALNVERFGNRLSIGLIINGHEGSDGLTQDEFQQEVATGVRLLGLHVADLLQLR